MRLFIPGAANFGDRNATLAAMANKNHYQQFLLLAYSVVSMTELIRLKRISSSIV
ncbi:hypothetical protein [Chitinophaga sp. Cy-1792]|uniref:hypothetical protein n=1 Tax=Chitinophaga sp. Cy-1792 TaxID=2608339 RepID=UPI00141F247B|nr:hypothetical protein [Chitinophaga sp. Cy-1792]